MPVRRSDRRDAAGRPEPGELYALLKLRSVPGIGDVQMRRMMEAHGTARAVLDRLRRDAADRVARTETAAARARIDSAFATLARTPEISVLPIGHPCYPERLLDLHDPPPLLFTRGDPTLLDRPGLAVVGTRANTEYGADVARMIAAEAAAAGFAVVSGLAHGIDRFAHEAALDAGGATIGVIGSGIDVTYPPRHQHLQERVARDGLLLSEFLPGQPALAHHFPRRNRIIAALASVVVVVEAPARSGALITAEHALDLGREVMAVPGPIGRRTSEGTNALLRDGAGLILDPADAIDALAGTPAGIVTRASPAEGSGSKQLPGDHPADGLPPPEGTAHHSTGPMDRVPNEDDPFGSESDDPTPLSRVRAAVSAEPVHADDLARAAGLPTGTTLGILLELELAGRIRQLPGLRFAESRPEVVARNRRGGRV